MCKQFNVLQFHILSILYSSQKLYIPMFCLQTPIPDHRSQIKPAATGHRNKESLENGKLRQVIGRALWCANEQKKLKFPEICLWHKHI